ncbi:Lactose transport system permease protein LacF [archaeon HR06]|nr:Lactose transport system permease protein LacF [archaeon HR06]
MFLKFRNKINTINLFAGVAPALVLGLFLYPLFLLIQTSLYKISLVKGELKIEEVGIFVNFYKVFTNSLFHVSVEVTIIFSLISVTLEVILGLFLTIAVANSKFKRLWISIIIISIVIPPVSVALIWRFIVYPELGLMDHLTYFLGLGRFPWLGDPFWARILIIMVDVWHWTSFVFL